MYAPVDPATAGIQVVKDRATDGAKAKQQKISDRAMMDGKVMLQLPSHRRCHDQKKHIGAKRMLGADMTQITQ
jgi:hypothetical protein